MNLRSPHVLSKYFITTSDANSLQLINLAVSFVRFDSFLSLSFTANQLNSSDLGSPPFFLQPVHASGRYYRNTLIEILVNDFGFSKVYRMCLFSPLTLLSIPKSMSVLNIEYGPVSYQQIRSFNLGVDDNPAVSRLRTRFNDRICRWNCPEGVCRSMQGSLFRVSVGSRTKLGGGHLLN